MHQRRPELWKNKSCVLHHDNMPSDSSLLVGQYLPVQSHSLKQSPDSGLQPTSQHSPNLVCSEAKIKGPLQTIKTVVRIDKHLSPNKNC